MYKTPTKVHPRPKPISNLEASNNGKFVVEANISALTPANKADTPNSNFVDILFIKNPEINCENANTLKNAPDNMVNCAVVNVLSP